MLLGLGKTLTFGQKKIYPYATGGDSVYLYEEGGKTYRVHEFLTAGITANLNVEVGGDMEYLVVAGGGAGGKGSDGGGGGGAGGMTFGVVNFNKNDSVEVYVGAGGLGVVCPYDANSLDGKPSKLLKNSSVVAETSGGGGGGFITSCTVNGSTVYYTSNGRNGGSGGGGRSLTQIYPGTGIAGQGNGGGTGNGSSYPWGAGAGGGGAGEIGESPGPSGPGGDGGDGLEWPAGSERYFAGGGGGRNHVNSGLGIGGSGGLGGGGNAEQNGTANTGGGGGGGADNSTNGGSGIVIFRYEVEPFTEAIEGEEEIFYTYDYDGYGSAMKTHHFTDPGENSIYFTKGGEVTITLIGGGGGGGHGGIGSVGNYSNNYVWGGGGGAGGVLQTTLKVSKGSTLTFNIGAGGSAGVDGYRGSNGEDTTFNGLTAFGGGGGGGGRSNNFSGNNGGCGGGAATYGCCVLSVSGSQNGGSGVSGQGYGGGLATGNNGFGGGGGGAGASGNANNVASDKGRGGNGKLLFLRYFGGGGGAGNEAGNAALGGLGGGGIGARSRSPGGNATSGVNGYGGGGGGGSWYNATVNQTGFLPGNGGNGGVLVSYHVSENSASTPLITDGLVLNLDAEDSASYPGSGTTWYDTSGYARNATINGNPSFIQNPNCFDITSDSTYISLSNSGLVPRTNPFTYSTWIKFDSFDTLDTIFENGSWQDTLLLRHQTNTVNVYAEAGYRGTFSWPTKNTGQWYNIVFLRESGGTCRMYVNNVLTGSPFNMTTDIDLANTNLFLMRSQFTTNQFTNGKIATFSVYNRALSGIEIEQNFTALRGRYGV